MNIEQLQTCADVLGQMSANFAAMPSGNTNMNDGGMSHV